MGLEFSISYNIYYITVAWDCQEILLFFILYFVNLSLFVTASILGAEFLLTNSGICAIMKSRAC